MGAVRCEQCSCITPVGSYIKQKTKMAGFSKVCLLLLVATSTLGQRAGKNLRGTFPFNSRNNNNAAHHEHHEEHHAHHNVDDTRDARQRGRGGGDDVALDIGSIAAAGERCIDKVVMVEETEYDDVVTCKHSYSEKCHTTYTTDFEPQQEESSMSSYSSEEQDSVGEFDFLSGSKVDQYDYAPTEYRHWDSEHYETQMYLEHQRQRLELEDYYPEYSLGRSFAETSRHMTTHDAYPTYDRYDNHDYFRYQDL